jgi:hypothetical protein
MRKIEIALGHPMPKGVRRRGVVAMGPPGSFRG